MIDRRGQVWSYVVRKVRGPMETRVVLVVGEPEDVVDLTRGDQRWTHPVVNLFTGKTGTLFDGTYNTGISLEQDPDFKRLV